MSEHWYDRAGGSQYDADLRKARKNGYVPSVTTVLSVVAKPALTNWLIDQAILAALTLPRAQDECEEAYLSRIKADGKAQALAAAEEGTRIHDACEKYLAGDKFDERYATHARAAVDELHRLFPDVKDWVVEKSFAHPLGYGGKVDVHSPSTGIVADYKTKDGDFSDGKRLHYDQNIQLAAYQVGLFLFPQQWVGGHYPPSKPIKFEQCANIFVSRTHAGKVASHVWSADEIAKGWRQFECALALWKELKGYDASF